MGRKIYQQTEKIRQRKMQIRGWSQRFLSGIPRRPKVPLLATIIPAIVIAFIALILFWPWDQDRWGAKLFSLSPVSGEKQAALPKDSPAPSASGPMHDSLPSRETDPSGHGYRPEAVVIYVLPKGKAKTARSFHYGIDRNGEAQQYAADEATAFHLGQVSRSEWDLFKPAVDPNYYTIGIAYEAEGNQPWGDRAYEVSAKLIAQIAQRWNLPIDRSHVIGYHEISGSDGAGLDPNDPARSIFCLGSGIDLDHLVWLAAGKLVSLAQPHCVSRPGVVTTRSSVNLRRSPSSQGELAGNLPPNYEVRHTGWVTDGESVDENSHWYKTESGHYLVGWRHQRNPASEAMISKRNLGIFTKKLTLRWVRARVLRVPDGSNAGCSLKTASVPLFDGV